MPYVVERDEQRRWLRVRVTGCLTIAEIVGIIRSVRADPADRMWPLLVDARSATTDTTEADIERAIEAVKGAAAQGPRGHVSIVADDDVLFARMLLYETMCAKAGVRVIRVFRRQADAERWLQIVSAARHFG